MSEYKVFQKNCPSLLQHSTLCLAKSIKRSFSLVLTLVNKVFQRMNVNSLRNLMCILDQYHDGLCVSWSHSMWNLLVILFSLTVEAWTSTTDWRLNKWEAPRCIFCALWDGKSAQEITFLYPVSDIKCHLIDQCSSTDIRYHWTYHRTTRGGHHRVFCVILCTDCHCSD